MSAEMGAGQQQQRVILWFRNDLRLNDNPIVHEAAQLVRKQLASEASASRRVRHASHSTIRTARVLHNVLECSWHAGGAPVLL